MSVLTGLLYSNRKILSMRNLSKGLKNLRSIIFSLSFWKNIFLSIYITTSERKHVPEFWKKLKNILLLRNLPPRRKSFFFCVLLNYYILPWSIFLITLTVIWWGYHPRNSQRTQNVFVVKRRSVTTLDNGKQTVVT